MNLYTPPPRVTPAPTPRRLLLAAACATALSCSDLGPAAGPAASNITFEFSGDAWGTFDASGPVSASTASSLSGTGAGVVQEIYGPEIPIQLAFAWTPTTPGLSNGVTIIAPQQPGTYQMAWGGGSSPAAGTGADISFYIGTELGDTTHGRVYRMEHGTLTIHETSPTRLRATFSGGGRLYRGNTPVFGRLMSFQNGSIEIDGGAVVVNKESSVGQALCTTTRLC